MKSLQEKRSTFPESDRHLSPSGPLKGGLPIALLSLKRQAVETVRELLPLSLRHRVYARIGQDVARPYRTAFEENGHDLFKIIHIETMSFCNGGCTFCAAAAQFKMMDGSKMPVEVYEKILSDLSQLDYRGRISLYCNNEPFLDKRLVEFVGMARRACPPAYIEIKTNGNFSPSPWRMRSFRTDSTPLW